MAAASASIPPDIGEAFQRLVPPGPVGVAVSGGGDSMALLAMLYAVRSEGLKAATVNHGLRTGAAGEARMVSAFCADRAIPHETLDVAGLAANPGNLQANARDARYGALADWARRHDLETVLLGHTMDDQAETVLMRLARGSGAEGLAGMAETRVLGGITFARPLLGARRADLRTWLKASDIPWAEDPSNDDPGFDRIKARRALEVLAPLGITTEGLAETATRLRRQTRVLHADLARLSAQALRRTAPDSVEIDRRALSEALPDTGLRLLAEQLMRVGGTAYKPRFRALEPLFARMTGDAQVRTTLAGCLVEARGDTITIRPEHDPNSSGA